MDFRLLHGAVQCLRWGFPKQRAIGDRKTAKLPKAVFRDGASDGRLRRIRAQQRAMHEVHSAQGEKTDRSHAQMLLAAGAKRSLRGPESLTDFGDIKWTVAICLQKLFEPRDDRIMA